MSTIELKPLEGATETQREFILSTDVEVCLLAPRGEGKCLHPKTQVMRHSGVVVPAYTVRPGDMLLGDDWRPRLVTSVTTGEGLLFEVKPEPGNGFRPFICNGPHILVLWNLHTCGFEEITVEDYLRLPDEKKEVLRLARPRLSAADKWVSRFTVQPLEKGQWVGFTLDESTNRRFLLGDYTITHNTESGIRRMVLHAFEQPEECRPIPWAIVRDTWRNLERTTLRSIIFPHPGSFAEKLRPLIRISGGGEKVFIPGILEIELFGVDSLGDLNRFQSMQLAGLWLEEPSPAVQEIGGGLDERVLTMGVSSLRYPCKWVTVQVTGNYPDESHWVWQRYGVKKLGRLIRIPRGENPHLPAGYREMMEQAFSGDKGLLDRLVYGQPGFVQQGEPVVPNYNPEIHRAKVVLEPYPGARGYRFWDGWLNPTCVIAQLIPSGQLQILEVFTGERMGMLQLVREFVKPAMKTRYKAIYEWEDIGDPTIANYDQSNFDYNQTAAAVIERELDTIFRPGERLWQPRREALRTAFSIVEPFPFVVLSGGEKTEILHKALRGGWHYRVLPSGGVAAKVPVKDKYSHCGDALSYGLADALRDRERLHSDRDFDEIVDWVWNESGRCPVTGY